jgi:hypothetical protein
VRLTRDQRRATQTLTAVAGPYRVTRDSEGWPVIPGRLGQIEHYDGVRLAVHTTGRLTRGRVLSIPGVQAHQTGDTELRALFHPDVLPEIARVIRARRRRSPDSAKHLRRAARPLMAEGPSLQDEPGAPDPADRALVSR